MTGVTSSRRLELSALVPELSAAGASVREISRTLGCGRDLTRRIMSEAGIQPRGALAQRKLNFQRTDVAISGDLEDLLTGLMLGDGGIDLREGCLPRLSLTNKSLEYIQYTVRALDAFGVRARTGPVAAGCFRLWTRSWLSLGDFANSWYSGGTKKRRIPDPCSLTPVALMHWWLGDGGLGRRLNKRPTGYLYTNSFAEEDVRRVANGLCADGIQALAMRCGGKQRHEWRIHLNRSGVTSLLDRIGPCPVSYYSYKWAVDEVYRGPDGRIAKLKDRDFRRDSEPS